MAWKHKTNAGRVVYERRRHYFTVRDVERIMDKVLEEAEKPAPRDDLRRFLRKIVDFYASTGRRFVLQLIQLYTTGTITPMMLEDNVGDIIRSFRGVIEQTDLLSWSDVSTIDKEERLV